MLTLSPSLVVTVELTGAGSGLISFGQADEELSLFLAPFGKGDKGDTGDEASLSSDPGNALSTGTDGGLFMAGVSLETQDW